MELIVDKDQNDILTLVERSTDLLLMERLRHGKKSKEVAKVVRRLLLPYKGELLKTITTDNWAGVRRAQMDIAGAKRTRLFHRLILLMAERQRREHQQTRQAIHT